MSKSSNAKTSSTTQTQEPIMNAVNTQTPEQIAELARLRNEKEVAEALAKTEVPNLEFAESSQPEEDSLQDRVHAQMIAMLMKVAGFAGNGISWKRKLAAFFGTLALSFGAGYLIGTLAGYAIVGIASLGGSMLWAYLIMVCALILAAYAGMKIGQHVGTYILSGQIDRDVVATKNKVLGWFKRKELTVATA